MLFQVMILSHDRDKGRLSLSTKKLEPTPGDMLRNPQLVYEKVRGGGWVWVQDTHICSYTYNVHTYILEICLCIYFYYRMCVCTNVRTCLCTSLNPFVGTHVYVLCVNYADVFGTGSQSVAV